MLKKKHIVFENFDKRQLISAIDMMSSVGF